MFPFIAAAGLGLLNEVLNRGDERRANQEKRDFLDYELDAQLERLPEELKMRWLAEQEARRASMGDEVLNPYLPFAMGQNGRLIGADTAKGLNDSAAALGALGMSAAPQQDAYHLRASDLGWMPGIARAMLEQSGYDEKMRRDNTPWTFGPGYMNEGMTVPWWQATEMDHLAPVPKGGGGGRTIDLGKEGGDLIGDIYAQGNLHPIYDRWERDEEGDVVFTVSADGQKRPIPRKNAVPIEAAIDRALIGAYKYSRMLEANGIAPEISSQEIMQMAQMQMAQAAAKAKTDVFPRVTGFDAETGLIERRRDIPFLPDFLKEKVGFGDIVEEWAYSPSQRPNSLVDMLASAQGNKHLASLTQMTAEEVFANLGMELASIAAEQERLRDAQLQAAADAAGGGEAAINPILAVLMGARSVQEMWEEFDRIMPERRPLRTGREVLRDNPFPFKE